MIYKFDIFSIKACVFWSLLFILPHPPISGSLTLPTRSGILLLPKTRNTTRENMPFSLTFKFNRFKMFNIINLTTTPTNDVATLKFAFPNASCSPYFHTCRNEVSKKACLATVTMGSGSIVHVSCLQNSSLVSSGSMCHDLLNFNLIQH